MKKERAPRSMLLIDAHVHLRPCFEVGTFLRGAAANFEQAAQNKSAMPHATGVLCMADSPRENGFRRLLAFADRPASEGAPLDRWTLRATKEDQSVYLVAGRTMDILVVAGRQLVSREGLEVLAVGTRQSFDVDRPLAHLIHAIAHVGALPVVPWGVGKWWGARGQHVADLVHDAQLPPFLLGDSMHRPFFWPRPSLFQEAAARGIRSVPGTDPLPFPHEAQRPGQFGVCVRGALSPDFPARDLKALLLDASTALMPYGRREGLFRFMRNQAAMQLRKTTQKEMKVR